MLNIVMLSYRFIYCYAECHYAESHYAESHYVGCHYVSVIMLGVVMLGVNDEGANLVQYLRVKAEFTTLYFILNLLIDPIS